LTSISQLVLPRTYEFRAKPVAMILPGVVMHAVCTFNSGTDVRRGRL